MSHIHVIYPHGRFDAALKILAAMYTPGYLPSRVKRKEMVTEAISLVDELIEACGMEQFNPTENSTSDFNTIMAVAKAFSEEVNQPETKNPG